MDKDYSNVDRVLRAHVHDFLNVGGDTEKYVYVGRGFNSLDENPSAQTEQKVYICDETASTSIKSYQTSFPFDTDLIKSEEAVMALYDIGRNQKTGADAELDYVRVELFRPGIGGENSFKARKFRVAVEVSSISGGGGEVIKVTGNLHNVGSFTDGEFNTVTRTFTSAAEAEAAAVSAVSGKGVTGRATVGKAAKQ